MLEYLLNVNWLINADNSRDKDNSTKSNQIERQITIIAICINFYSFIIDASIELKSLDKSTY